MVPPRVYRDALRGPCLEGAGSRAALQRLATPDQHGSAAPRRQRPKETSARLRAGSRRGQSRLHKSNKRA